MTTTPTITSPAPNAVIYAPSFGVTWTAPAQDAYEIEVYKNSQPTVLLYDSGEVPSTTGSTTVSFGYGFGSGDTYTIRLRVKSGGVWSTFTSVGIVHPRVPDPVVTAPTNNSSFAEKTKVVTWTADLQHGYEVYVEQISDGARVWVEQNLSAATTRSVVPTFPNLGQYAVRVRVYYDGAWSSPLGPFVTRTAPVAPAITTPANGAQFVADAQTLNWTAALQEGYEVRILNNTGAVEWTSGDVTSVVRTLGLSFPIQGVKTVDIRVRYDGYWSSRTSITVDRTAPPVPVITAPANGASFATLLQTVNWTSSRQQAYEIRTLRAATGAVEGTSGVVSGTALTRDITFPNLGNVTIDLRVRDESVWSPYASVTVYVSPTPVITSLTGGVVAAANETLVGNHSTPFEGDDYQAAVKSRWRLVGAGVWTEGAAQTGSQNFYTYPSSLAVGDYERQVAVSLNATGEWSPWSASGLFTVFVRPPMPAIVVPVPNTTVADRVNVEWTAPSQDAFEIQVRNGAVVEWSSGVVVSNPLRVAEVLFPTLGERIIYLRVRNNTLWSNEGMGRSWVTLPVSVVATPVTSLDRVIDPFVASSLGYDTVNLTWTPPLPTNWSGYRIVRSRSGFPTTVTDGVVAHEVIGGSWATHTGYANVDLPGGWHYYTFFLRTADGATWVRVATTDVLVPYDFATTDKLWDTIPEYYKHIRDDSADQSIKNLRINPELYLSNDYTAPNLLLSSFLHLFGIGLDHVRTQIEDVVTGYGSNDVHISRLNLLAKQFGRDLEQAVPAYANRTVVRNLAYLYRKRGTLDGIAELATMTTGYDVEVTLGPNMMLNEDQAALANPEYAKWDAARYYTPGIRVEYGSYIFQNVVASSGQAQAPANSGVNNTWWNAIAVPVNDRTNARVDTGDVSTWQYNLNPGGVISGKTNIGVGVVDPQDALMFQTNALVLERTDANGATNITAMSVPTVAAAGQSINTKRQVLEAGIPLPVETTHVVGQVYVAGDLVRYNTFVYEALVDTSALPTVTTDWKRVSNANVAPRQRLSVYAHGPFSGTAGTGARAVTLVVNQYDAEGAFISELTGVDAVTNSGAVGDAWTRPYYTFTPANNARYLGVGARVASPGLNEKQYLTKWMLERPEISVSTPSVYSKAREAQVLVKADTVNMATDPRAIAVPPGGGLGWANTRGFGGGTGAGTYTLQTGVVGHPAGITTALRKTWTGTASQNGDTGFDHGSAVAVVPDEVWTISAYLRTTASGKTARMRALWDGGGEATGAPTQLMMPNTWYRLSFTFTVPAGKTSFTPVTDINAGGVSWVPAQWLEGTGLLITRTDALHPYFDGSTTTDAVWEGTPHASRSHLYENLLERKPALTRALQDTVPIGIGVGTPRFGVWTG